MILLAAVGVAGISIGLGVILAQNTLGTVNNPGESSSSAATGCIVTVFDKQYDVTPLRKTHTGGDVFTCGTDMSAAYEANHGTKVGMIAKYLVSSDTVTSVSSVSTNNTSSASVSMTLAELATHNTVTSCYVAYNGVVYDVTNNRSWVNCRHHGQTGGIDMTSTFPHTTGYLKGIPVVGTLQGGTTTSAGVNAGSTEIENEVEND